MKALCIKWIWKKVQNNVLVPNSTKYLKKDKISQKSVLFKLEKARYTSTTPHHQLATYFSKLYRKNLWHFRRNFARNSKPYRKGNIRRRNAQRGNKKCRCIAQSSKIVKKFTNIYMSSISCLLIIVVLFRILELTMYASKSNVVSKSAYSITARGGYIEIWLEENESYD